MTGIISNDREFICGSRDFYVNYNGYNFQQVPSNVSIDINGLKIDELRTHIDGFIVQLNDVINVLMVSIQNKEQLIAITISTGMKTIDNSLFSKLNMVASKIKKIKQQIKVWHRNIYDIYNDVIVNINKYSEVLSRLNTLKLTNNNFVGLSKSITSLAVKHQSKSASIQRDITKLIRFDTQIQNLIQNLNRKLYELNSGLLILDDNSAPIDLNELNRLINELDDNDSPLTKIQKHISEIIVSQPINIQYDTKTAMPTFNFNEIQTKLNNEDDLFKLVQRINDVRTYLLYTDETKQDLDDIFKIILKQTTSETITNLVSETHEYIRNNIPRNVLTVLRQELQNNTNIYLNVYRIKGILKHMKQLDSAVYKDEFIVLLKEFEKKIQDNLAENIT